MMSDKMYEITQILKMLFEDYNRMIAKLNDNLIEEFSRQHPVDELEENLDKLYQSAKEKAGLWDNAPNAIIGQKTPAQYFASIDSTESALCAFKTGCDIIEESFPQAFTNVLSSYKAQLIPHLLDMATDIQSYLDEKNSFSTVMALKMLGAWQEESVIEPIINAMIHCPAENESFCEPLWEALTAIGNAALIPIIRTLNDTEDIATGQEYLLIALAEIGKKSPSDFVYYCLKNTFTKMKNKIYGAICLGQYGDSRAIAFLRGYYQKNSHNLDQETLMELKAAISVLGGQTGDL